MTFWFDSICALLLSPWRTLSCKKISPSNPFVLKQYRQNLSNVEWRRQVYVMMEIEYYTGMFTGIICTLVIFSVCSRVFTAKQTDQDVVNPTVPRPSIQPNDLKPHRFSCEASLFASCRWKHLPRISVKNTTKASLLYLCLLTLTVSSDVETNPRPDYPCGCCGREVSGKWWWSGDWLWQLSHLVSHPVPRHWWWYIQKPVKWNFIFMELYNMRPYKLFPQFEVILIGLG